MRRIDFKLMAGCALATWMGVCAMAQAQNPAAQDNKAKEEKATPSKTDKDDLKQTHDLYIKRPPAHETLDEALANALKNNPDIRVAESKVHEAEAELNRSRLLVTQKVVSLFRNLETQKKTVALSEAHLERTVQLHKSAQVPASEIGQAEIVVQTQKAKLAEMEADLAYLTGKQSPEVKLAADVSVERGIQFTTKTGVPIYNSRIAFDAKSGIQALDVVLRKPVEGPTADKIRKSLDSIISYESDEPKLPLGDALKNLEKLGGVTFLVNIKDADLPPASRFRFKNLPLGAVLQAFEDIIPGLRFTVREYGILVTLKTSAPEDGMRLRDFWKKLQEKEKTEAKEAETPKRDK